MLIKDVINLIDYPDDVTVEIYSYIEDDVVFHGICENIPEEFLEEYVRGIEIPEKNTLLINF